MKTSTAGFTGTRKSEDCCATSPIVPRSAISSCLRWYVGGDLTIAVSTSGKSPALAKQLRQYLEDFFGPEYEPFLQLMGEVRRRLLQQEHAPEAHKPIFERLIAAPFLRWIREENTEDIDRFLAEVLGEGYDYRSLMGIPDAKATPGDGPPPKA